MESIAAKGARARWIAERRFFTGMAIAMLLVAYVGFARSFFLRPVFPEWPSPSEPIFYVHGVFFSAWCVLLVFQAMLVGVGRTDVHRKVGVLGVVIALGMVILGVAGALIAANRPTGFNGVPVPPLQFLVVPLFDMAFFGAFVGLGVANRTNPQSHKRWMVLATVTLLGAAFARWPYVWKLGNPFVYFGLAVSLHRRARDLGFPYARQLAPGDTLGRAGADRVAARAARALGHRRLACVRHLADGTRALKRQVDDGRCGGGRPAALVD